MPMLRSCAAPDCKTLTFGRLCIDHEDTTAAASEFPHREPVTPAFAPPSPGPPPQQHRVRSSS
jgi:hypothetical protein